MRTTWVRWLLGAIVALCIVALLAWARNDAGVDDRDPDPPQGTEVINDEDTIAPQDTTAAIDADTVPPTYAHRGPSTMDDAAEEKMSEPRPPSFLDTLIPSLVLIALAYTFTGFHIEHVEPPATPADGQPAPTPEGDVHVD